MLDIGCGVGYLGQARPELRWVGIDINPEACREAARFYAEEGDRSQIQLTGVSERVLQRATRQRMGHR